MRLKMNRRVWGRRVILLVCHLMSEIFTSLEFGLLGTNSLKQKFHSVLCEQRNQQSIVYTGPVMCCKGWAPLTDSTLGGTAIESLFSLQQLNNLSTLPPTLIKLAGD